MSPLSLRSLDLGPGGQGTASVAPCYYVGSHVVSGSLSSVRNMNRDLVIQSSGSLLPPSGYEVVLGEVIVTGGADSEVLLFFDFD